MDCFISSGTGTREFEKTDAKLYVSILTLCTQNNSKLLGQLQSGFKKTIKWNKFQTKV